MKLIELDSILFGTEPNDSGPVVENEQPSSVEQEPLPRLRPKHKNNRTTRLPRGASKNVQYCKSMPLVWCGVTLLVPLLYS